MGNGLTKLVAMTVVVMESVSFVTAATSASAQNVTLHERKIEQQQTIARQQQRVLKDRQLLESQQRQLADKRASTEDSVDSSSDEPDGLLSCPPGYHKNMTYGCLPELKYLR